MWELIVMKIRTSFVSNSSTGSFIVRIKDLMEEKRSITQKEENILLNYGFKYAHASYPEHIEYNNEIEPEPKDEGSWQNLFYKVICNEDEVITFLLENNIPFLAMTHYGNNYYIYEKNKNYIIWFPNYGAIFTTYHSYNEKDENRKDFFKNISEAKTFDKIPISDWGITREDKKK